MADFLSMRAADLSVITEHLQLRRRAPPPPNQRILRDSVILQSREQLTRDITLMNKPVHLMTVKKAQNKNINADALLPLLTNDNVKPISYSLDHLKRVIMAALEKIEYTQPTKDIDREMLKNIFLKLTLKATRLQIEEAFIFSTFEESHHHIVEETSGGSDGEHSVGYKKRAKRKPALNLSVDSKHNSDKKTFHISKFVIWLKKNMQKLSNYTDQEVQKIENKKTTQLPPVRRKTAVEGEVFKNLPDWAQRRKTMEKHSKNRLFWDLRTRIDQEKNFRKKNVLTNIVEMGFYDEVQLMNTESLVPMIQLKVDWDEDDRKDCIWGVNKLKEINQEIKDKMKTVVQEINKEQDLVGKDKTVTAMVLESYKKKLADNAMAGARYAGMARSRIRQKKLQKELKTKLEMSAILQEQDSAEDASRLYGLMCDDRIEKELKGFKKTLTDKEERRVKSILNSRF